MNYLSRCGLFQLNQIADDAFFVHLTKKGLSHYGMFYVYIPRIIPGQKIQENQIVVNIETSCVLSPIRSPIAGIVNHVNNNLEDTPFAINLNTPLYSVNKVPPESLTSLVSI